LKIFITIPWFLPAYKAGGPIQSVANLVNNFTENIEYYIFCGDTDLNNEPLQNIVKGEWLQFNNQTKVWYASKESLSETLAKQIENLKPEVVYIIGLFDWHFNIVPLIFCRAEKKILSVRGMLHPGALTQKKWKKRFFLQILKVLGISNKVVFHATDEAEATFIKNEFGSNAIISVAGNFAKSVKRNESLHKIEGDLTMVTIALISPMKNHLEVLKALMLCKGTIFYNIYGPIKDADYWEQCKAQILMLPINIKVQYHGEVLPNNVENILSQNHLFIMPSKSENFGHSIAEALSAAKPVITSNATPWNELQQNNAGINVEISEKNIAGAINFFVALNNNDYNIFTEGAVTYSNDKLELVEKNNAYQKLFFK
jgi:glycosyltransferase involved in cell wall biosynthesis